MRSQIYAQLEPKWLRELIVWLVWLQRHAARQGTAALTHCNQLCKQVRKVNQLRAIT